MKKLSLILLMIALNLVISPQTSAQTFNGTGTNQSYIIPATGTLTITAKGADGATTLADGGSGATVQADFPVLMNDELIVVVGKAGVGNLDGNGFGGGGGGSAVILKRGITSTLLIVAGAGGGSSLLNSNGKGGVSADGSPAGGTSPAATGGGGFNANGNSIMIGSFTAYSGGQAGTLTGGGAGGVPQFGPFAGGPSGGFGFGGGGSGNSLLASGGGGGGYSGGNGGSPSAGGNGGTSFIQTSGIVGTNPVRTDGVKGGGTGQDGSVILNFVCGAPTPDLFTAYPGDARVPAGQQSATVCQNSGDVIFQFSNCIGGTVNWTGTDGSSGNGNIIASSANPGTVTYSATCTLEGCTSEESEVTVTTNAPPTVTVSGNTSVVLGYGSNCTTLQAQPTGNGPFSYIWKSGNVQIGTSASQQVCPEQTTTYSVTVTDANGCSTTREVTVYVQDVRCGPRDQNVQVCYYGVTLCVNEKTAKNYLKLGATLGACGSSNVRIGAEEAPVEPVLTLTVKAYPNPTSGALMVQVNSPVAGPAQLDVLDVAGRTVQQRVQELSEGSNEVELNLAGQGQGTYLLRVRNALGRQAVVRVQKQ